MPRCLEQQYNKWQELRKWKNQFVQSYTDELYRLMARFGVQEEEKLFVLKYINGLSLYIQQEMEFMAVSMLADAFHYASKLEAKQKGKACFATKPIGQTSNKKPPTDSDKSRQPSQMNMPKHNHGNMNFYKYKRDHSKQPPTGKCCDYHNSSWHDTFECKYRKIFLAKLSISDFFDKNLVELEPKSSNLLTSTLIALTASIIVDEEEQESMFHRQI